MSLKRFIVFSFLLFQLTHGQNLTFFGLTFPAWGAPQLKTNATITNSTVLLHTNSSSGESIIQADAGHTSSVQVSAKPITQTTKTPGWNQIFSSIDLNGLRASFVRTTPDLKNLSLILITRKHCNNIHENPVCKFTKSGYGLSDTKALMKDEHFKIDRKTVIYFPGFKDDLETEGTQLIIDAYLQRNDHNLIFCDYQDLIDWQYLKNIVLNLEIKALAVAKMIYKLNAKGLDLSLLHLVGHSLGAQMAGCVGKSFIDLTQGSKTIKRITGLDPGFLLFYPPIGRHITAKDAIFVDIIHTDAWGYGAPVATGSVDFWPNGGSGPQPGCVPKDNKILAKLDTCSHHRAVRFYAESLLTENAFMTLKCPSWYKFKKNICQSKITAYMGYDAKPGITGNYYLRTNHQQPFTRKHHGVIFDYVD